MTQPSEKTRSDVVAYGMISLDNVVRVPHPPKAGRHANVMADYYKLGGKALNIALPLSTWGHRVTLAGNWLGEDPYADFIERELEEFPDVDTRWLVRDARVRTPFSRILVLPDGEQRVLRYWFEEASEKPLTGEMLRGARILSVEPSGKKEEIQAVRAARDAGLLVVASDVVWPEHSLLPHCDWVITSRAVLQWHFPGVPAEAHLRALQEARRFWFSPPAGSPCWFQRTRCHP
jgi:sugar/nucleoside kinase (ribokinase family)